MGAPDASREAIDSASVRRGGPVSALDAFMATWAQARATFGAGCSRRRGAVRPEQPASPTAESTSPSAAPGSNWTGGGSDVLRRGQQQARPHPRQRRRPGSAARRRGGPLRCGGDGGSSRAGRRQAVGVRRRGDGAEHALRGSGCCGPSSARGQARSRTSSRGRTASCPRSPNGSAASVASTRRWADDEGKGGTKLRQGRQACRRPRSTSMTSSTRSPSTRTIQAPWDLADTRSWCPIPASGSRTPQPVV